MSVNINKIATLRNARGGNVPNVLQFAKDCQAFGAEAYRATTPEEFADAMDKALPATGPVWIECVISRNERVLPMIPGGKSVEDMIID